jgi:glycosyltransferase involved in cell wall biosynthesis
MTKPLVLIPAYNSFNYLEKLIPGVLKYIPDILVVDDGSTDATTELADSPGVHILRHSSNRGKGAALKTGFDYALREGFEVIVTLDSDGQHDPQYIPAFLKAYEDTNCDLIIGSRIHDKVDMPWDRRFSNWTTSHLLSLLLRAKIEDIQSGYRLYSRRLLESLHLESDRFELETEIVIKAVQSGMMPNFIPIRVEYGYGFPSQMNRFSDTLRWCRRVLEFL